MNQNLIPVQTKSEVMDFTSLSSKREFMNRSICAMELSDDPFITINYKSEGKRFIKF